MLKRTKRRIIEFSILGSLLGMLVFTVASTAVGVAKAMLDIDAESFFTATVDGYTYRCYHIKDDQGGSTTNIAVAYGGDYSTTTDQDTISVPSTITHESTTYTVKAIAEGAFRYCNFSAISVPQTVEEIRQEAFAYCTSLEYFEIPNKIDKIFPSTFLDCRALKSVYYTNSSGARTFGNSVITEIGDHAFDSCISLRDFFSPRTNVYYGESCFQNCQSLINFYFPSAVIESGQIQNYITVRPYAFANCSSLTFVYFETNMKEIDNYAFADASTQLSMKYNGTSVPTFTRVTEYGNVTQTHWRDEKITSSDGTLHDLQINHPTILSDDDYPCLRYTVDSETRPLDSAAGRTPTVDIIDAAEIAKDNGEYAVIYKFDTPSQTYPGCFDIDTGALTIPNTLNGHVVKVIREQTFANNLDIRSVSFNEGLVQIAHQAFYHCTNIESLDFSRCLSLREISYKVFQDFDVNYHNDVLEELILPDCLEYLGDYAFSNFYYCNSLTLGDGLLAFGDSAFNKLGYKITSAQIDLILPKSLSDAEAERANFTHFVHNTYNHTNYTRWCAIGKYAFEGANGLRSITMEDDPDHEADTDPYGTSIFSNAFKECINLIRFVANKNVKTIGKDLFKGCTSLREVFFTTGKAEKTSYNYPWCLNEDDGQYGGTLFTGAHVELVIYVDGPKAPKQLPYYSTNADTNDVAVGHLWNSETTDSYSHELTGSGDATAVLSRTTIPTFYNISDYENDVKYWDPKDTTQLAPRPIDLEDYGDGVISFAKGTDGKYTVARYYYDPSRATGHDFIDLTAVPTISDGTTNNLTKIGDEAFARNAALTDTNDQRTKQPGCYFVLPTTITEIGERAFMRKTNGGKEAQKNNARFGIRILTYKTAGGKYISKTGTELTLAQLQSAITSLEGQSDVNKRGYCAIPNSVTKIGKDAFYNNIFKEIILPSSLTYIGASAFYVNPVNASNPRITNTSITFTNNDYFKLVSNGLYYIGTTDHQMLLYQMEGGTGTLTLDSSTKALAFSSCSNTSYTTINLGSNVLAIYGGGLANNKTLTTINNATGLRYIGSMENATGKNNGWSDDGYDEVFTSSMAEHMSNTDYKKYSFDKREIVASLVGAVKGCEKLTTLNFKTMTELRKIGWNAFSDDSKLANMVGTDTYTYKKYVAGGTYSSVDNGTNTSTGVLDLSGLTHLRSIGGNAFSNCGSIKFIHLPCNMGIGDTESAIYIGYDPENYMHPKGSSTRAQIITDNKGTNVLVGDSALYAHHDFGKDNGSLTHYGAKPFGNGNNIYYHFSTIADVPTDDSTSIKYWTYSGGNYILFDSAIDVREYLGV